MNVTSLRRTLVLEETLFDKIEPLRHEEYKVARSLVKRRILVFLIQTFFDFKPLFASVRLVYDKSYNSKKICAVH